MKTMNSNEIEAANRAEVTAILIRAGYRVYRPEADVSGEDLVVRTPDGELRLVQMKSRPTVDKHRYGGNPIWMLFPDPKGDKHGRPWYLIKHDALFSWVEKHHRVTTSQNKVWHSPQISSGLRDFLQGAKAEIETVK